MAKPSKKGDGIRRAIKKTARQKRKHAAPASSPKTAKKRQDDENAVNDERLERLGRQALIARLQQPFANANADAAFTV